MPYVYVILHSIVNIRHVSSKCYEICATFLHMFKIKCTFFNVCSKIIVFGGFSVGAKQLWWALKTGAITAF